MNYKFVILCLLTTSLINIDYGFLHDASRLTFEFTSNDDDYMNDTEVDRSRSDSLEFFFEIEDEPSEQ